MKAIFDGLTDGQATMLVGLLVAASASVGAGFSALIGYFKDRGVAAREMRRLAIEAALENWRHQNLLKIDIVKQVGGYQKIDSPDSYIIHMLRIINIAADMKLSPYEAANRISQWSNGEIGSDGAPKPKNEENEQDVHGNPH
jgi:hypothetical protein